MNHLNSAKSRDICKTLFSFSGMSPFLDDSDSETRNNILNCDFAFPDDCKCSAAGRDLVASLLGNCFKREIFFSPFF